MKFRAHDTFFIRKGWLSKGMKAVHSKPDVFVAKDENPMDVLGIGSNMVKSLRYWLVATNLTEEALQNKHRVQKFTGFGDQVFENDRFMEEYGTLYLLHYMLSKNEEDATAWYFFFNEFNMSEFTREDFVAALQNYVSMRGETVAIRSISDDFACILNTYLPRYKTNPKCLRNVTEALLDNTVDEIQEKKIEYNINGYANILNGSEVNEDFSLTFFKTLAQLNELDIRILRCYAGYMGDGGESVQDICENTGIDYTQVRFVKEKLSRYGLLQSRNEEINDKNMESMVKYMQDVERESHKSKPKDVKVPKLKKPFGTDSYSITMLGRRYLALMQL